MTQWHGDRNKRKITGGKKRPYKGKRSFERGGEAVLTEIGKRQRKITQARGNTTKIKLLNTQYVNVTNPVSGRTERAEILRVIRNPVNIDYDRRKIITKSTIIETSIGRAVVTSRPGQNGIINSKLLQ